MSVDAAFEANAQLAEGGKPGVGSFDDPTVTPEAIVALNAFASDAAFDAPAPEMLPATGDVIGLVCMQFAGPAPWSAALARHGRQGIDQLLEDHRVVSVGPGHAEHQRDALAVRDEVALAAELAAVCRVGARVRAPRGLGTLAPSTLTRLKSSRPALRSSANKSKCKRCHTPAACQSRSLRQQVMPLPKPNSWGKSSHPMPVRSTNRIPLRARSSSSLGRPPLGDCATSGSSGLIFFHSVALISAFLFMPPVTHLPRSAMTAFC